jgi:ATPase family associated with various cellular activities (AAA)
MASESSSQSENNAIPQNLGLLGSGWRPLNRDLDWGYLWHLIQNDSWELTQKTLGLVSEFANALGRQEYTWWANFLNLFSGNLRYEIDEFWDYLTPDYSLPGHQCKDILSVETPQKQTIDRNSIPIDYVLNRLQEITVLKILDLLGRPDVITQIVCDRAFYYPTDRFSNWERLEVLGTIYAYWSKHQIWLTIYQGSSTSTKRYILIANDLKSWIDKATYNVAIMLSGYQNRIGQVQSQHSIRTFSREIQYFTDTVQQAILEQPRLAILVHGEPGTGKTAWTQAVAKEILAPLRYVIFILDHDAVENFVPPSYLERICLIINEADNLAQNRANEAAQRNNKTEHILSLLDGTLHQSVLEADGIQEQQRFVILMTCNTTDRLDPAVLRKGRIDLMCEFQHRFV